MSKEDWKNFDERHGHRTYSVMLNITRMWDWLKDRKTKKPLVVEKHPYNPIPDEESIMKERLIERLKAELKERKNPLC